MNTKHIITDVELEKHGYGHDVLTYQADGQYTQIDGEFYIDKAGMLHHSHIFPDGEEVEITIKY